MRGASSEPSLKTPEAPQPWSPTFTILSRKTVDTDGNSGHCGVLRSPWIWSHNFHIPDRVLVMARRNYKFYADLVLSNQFMVRQLPFLDTGAAPNLIHLDLISPTLRAFMQYVPGLDIEYASNKPLQAVEMTTLTVRLGTYLVQLDFVVCKSLVAPVILGCDVGDLFVEAIHPGI